jgi:hypothetical protein
MLGSFRRPKAETVMMLTGQDHGLKTAGPQALDDRLSIKGGRVENGWIFVA